MITFDQVSKRYGERLAIDSLSWHMKEGDCVVFLGHSGAGKTTLLRLITHETQPTAGRITVGTFRGGRLTRSQRALLRRTLGIIYEDFRLLGDRTVFENVALAVRIAGHSRDDEVIPRVMYALEEVGLQLQQNAYPHELSAGEKQRAAIARAIVNRPAVILADEPTGALEQRSANEVLSLLRRIHKEGAALIVVTTRREVAEGLPGRVIEIQDGRVTAGDTGSPAATPEPDAGSSAPEPDGGSEAPAAAQETAPEFVTEPAAPAAHEVAPEFVTEPAAPATAGVPDAGGMPAAEAAPPIDGGA
jgi:cell division transport system ATP-binding protein